MTTGLASSFTLTDDELQVIGNRIGIHSFPVVLSIRPRHSARSVLDAAFDHATSELSERGLIADGLVSVELIQVVRTLERPDRELSMRLVTPEGIARIAVVRNGRQTVLARRIDNQVLLREIEGRGELRDATQALMGELPGAEAAQVNAVGAPIVAMSEALNGTRDAAELSDTIKALGTDARSAMLLGSALASRLAFAEIVYHAIDRDDDRTVRTPAAVGVFYTKRGRLVSAPSISPSGQIWATLKGGSNHTIMQAIGQLIELLPHGWEASR